MFFLILGSGFSGARIAKTGQYRVYPIGGCVVLILGSGLLASVDEHTAYPLVALYLSLIAVGIGFVIPTVALVAQSSVAYRDMATASASANFLRELGGAVCVVVRHSDRHSVGSNRVLGGRG